MTIRFSRWLGVNILRKQLPKYTCAIQDFFQVYNNE